MPNPIHYGSFLRGTPITKIDGQKVPIEEIKRGDLLRGIGPEGESNTSQVLIIARDFCQSYLTITTEDTQLKVSGKHRIYVGPDVPSDAECPHFVRANTLKVNDYLYFNQKKTRIVDITEIDEKAEVFNLKCDRPGVAATHDDEDCWATFHAAGIAVHEMGACAPIGITHIIPNCGPPGTLVTIIARDDGAVHAYEGFDGFFGDNVCGCAIFCNPGYVTGVTFGGNPATVLGSSRFICHAIAPQGSGTVTIAATTDWSGGTTAFESGSNEFTYSDFCGYGWRLNPPHQKHSTGATNKSISHDKPMNKWTTGKGIGMRRRYLLTAPPPPPPPPPPFGYNGNTHQRHDTGQTNYSIPNDLPLNEWTTTKGIGLRRKWILGIEPPPIPALPTFKTIRACNCLAYIPPPIPMSFEAEALSVSANISLNWGDVEGATCYNIYRSTSTGTETLYQSCVPTSDYIDTAITPENVYYYKVASVGNAGVSGFSSEVSMIGAYPTLNAHFLHWPFGNVADMEFDITLTFGGVIGPYSCVWIYDAPEPDCDDNPYNICLMNYIWNIGSSLNYWPTGSTPVNDGFGTGATIALYVFENAPDFSITAATGTIYDATYNMTAPGPVPPIPQIFITP